jgi:hypothetical protein
MRLHQRKLPSTRPVRDGSFFLNAIPALRTGLLSSGPPGTSLLRMLLSLMLTQMGQLPGASSDAQPVIKPNSFPLPYPFLRIGLQPFPQVVQRLAQFVFCRGKALLT